MEALLHAAVMLLLAACAGYCWVVLGRAPVTKEEVLRRIVLSRMRRHNMIAGTHRLYSDGRH